jgi:FtsX extracellular domain
VTRPWLLRRIVGDARRHRGVWLALAAAFGVVGFCAAGARLATRAATEAAVAGAAEPVAHIIVSLKDDLGAEEIGTLRGVLTRLPGVEEVRSVSAREGLERLVHELGDRASLLDGVGSDLMFPTLEIAARPASAASALAFRLRRLSGVADVDLVPATPASASPAPPWFGARGPWLVARVAALGGGVAALLALLWALALLRARLRPDLSVLVTLGVTRATSLRPALALATVSAAVGATLGLVGASGAGRAWLGLGALAAREGALGGLVLVALAFVAARIVLHGVEAAGAG